MSFVPAKCPQCGANIQVDSSKEAGICSHCGTPFVTEKVINQTNNYDFSTQNVENQTNIYVGESRFAVEKNQCRVLLMLLKNLDLQYLKERALKVMETNPDNTLAQMIYDCNFSVTTECGEVFLSFYEKPLWDYIAKECGNIDVDTCVTFVIALTAKSNNTTLLSNIVSGICDNIQKQNLSEAEVFDAYRRMVEVICATDDISKLLSGAKEMSSSNNDVVKQNGKAMMAMVKEISLNRQIMANTLKLRIADMNLAEDMKNSLLSKLNGLVEFLENDVDKSSGSTLTGKQLFFIIGWMLIFLCAIITMLT